MNRYVVSAPARLDLHVIWNYIAEHTNGTRADRVLRKLRETMRKVALRPGLGHLRDDLADETLRVWVVYSYIVIYRPDTRPIETVRVLHGARDLGALLGDQE